MTLFNLPRDVLKIILAHNSAKELRSIRRVSRAGQSISGDDALWRDLLIKDFHFTAITAHNLLQKLVEYNNSSIKEFFFPPCTSDVDRTSSINNATNARSTSTINYEFVYKYCKKYQHNSFQQQAFLKLWHLGLTPDHLRGRYWFNSSPFIDILSDLIIKRKMDATSAMAEIDGLSDCQAAVLAKLHCRDLTIDQLHRHGLGNSLEVLLSLKNLMATRGMDASVAIAETTGLETYQIEGIGRGLTRQQVTGLNRAQTGTLASHHDRGLTVDHVRSPSLLGCDYPFEAALSYLISVRKMDGNTAMAEITGLNRGQVVQISQGKTRDQVLLTNNSESLNENNAKEENPDSISHIGPKRRRLN